MSKACAQGLRTLVLGTKLLDPDWFHDWDTRYEEAKGALSQRDERLAALGREVEQDLELVGATAIEDKLQVCVSPCWGAEEFGEVCVCVCVWLWEAGCTAALWLNCACCLSWGKP